MGVLDVECQDNLVFEKPVPPEGRKKREKER